MSNRVFVSSRAAGIWRIYRWKVYYPRTNGWNGKMNGCMTNGGCSNETEIKSGIVVESPGEDSGGTKAGPLLRMKVSGEDSVSNVAEIATESPR